MGQSEFEALSEREQLVLESIATSRKPQKQMAADLGISHSRLSQHVRDLKDRFAVNTLDELANVYNARVSGDYKKVLYEKSQVPPAAPAPQEGSRSDPGLFSLSDAGVLQRTAPWQAFEEPRVVPEELDGPRGTAGRIVSMLFMVGVVLALVILGVAAIRSVGEMTAGYEVASENSAG